MKITMSSLVKVKRALRTGGRDAVFIFLFVLGYAKNLNRFGLSRCVLACPENNGNVCHLW